MAPNNEQAPLPKNITVASGTKSTSQREPENIKAEPVEKIEVGKATLEKVLARVEKLERDNEILREVADKNRLGRVEEMRAQGKLVKKVGLNTYNGKIVVGWKKVRDDVFFDNQGRLHEDQVSVLYFRGETKPSEELNERAFSRLLVKIPVEVLEEGRDKEGNINFTVQLADGDTLKIDSKFIN